MGTGAPPDALGVTQVALDTSQHTAPFYARPDFREVRRTPSGYGPGLDRVDMISGLPGQGLGREGSEDHL